MKEILDNGWVGIRPYPKGKHYLPRRNACCNGHDDPADQKAAGTAPAVF